jgi:hypothetical protein
MLYFSFRKIDKLDKNATHGTNLFTKSMARAKIMKIIKDFIKPCSSNYDNTVLSENSGASF